MILRASILALGVLLTALAFHGYQAVGAVLLVQGLPLC